MPGPPAHRQCPSPVATDGRLDGPSTTWRVGTVGSWCSSHGWQAAGDREGVGRSPWYLGLWGLASFFSCPSFQKRVWVSPIISPDPGSAFPGAGMAGERLVAAVWNCRPPWGKPGDLGTASLVGCGEKSGWGQL